LDAPNVEQYSITTNLPFDKSFKDLPNGASFDLIALTQ
jgi:hypothetical protein